MSARPGAAITIYTDTIKEGKCGIYVVRVKPGLGQGVNVSALRASPRKEVSEFIDAISFALLGSLWKRGSFINFKKKSRVYPGILWSKNILLN